MNWSTWWIEKVILAEILRVCPSLPFWLNGKRKTFQDLLKFKIRDLVTIHRALCGVIVDEFIDSLFNNYLFNVDESLLGQSVEALAAMVENKLIGSLHLNEPTDIVKALDIERIIDSKELVRWMQVYNDVQRGLRDLPVDITNVVEDNHITFSADNGFLEHWIGDEIIGAYMIDDYTIILTTGQYSVVVVTDQMMRFVITN